jgi:hypothetical protein
LWLQKDLDFDSIDELTVACGFDIGTKYLEMALFPQMGCKSSENWELSSLKSRIGNQSGLLI